MERVRLESSVIRSVGYRPETAELEIEFTSGDLYRYFAVPPSVYRGLLDSESAGRFLQQNIRDEYPYIRVR
jgi:hypothetical protein